MYFVETARGPMSSPFTLIAMDSTGWMVPPFQFALESVDCEFDSAGPSTATVRMLFEGKIAELYNKGKIHDFIFSLDHFGQHLSLKVLSAKVEHSLQSQTPIIELSLVNEWSIMDQLMIHDPFRAQANDDFENFPTGLTSTSINKTIIGEGLRMYGPGLVEAYRDSRVPLGPVFVWHRQWEPFGELLRKMAASGAVVEFDSKLDWQNGSYKVRFNVRSPELDPKLSEVVLGPQDCESWTTEWDYQDYFTEAIYFNPAQTFTSHFDSPGGLWANNAARINTDEFAGARAVSHDLAGLQRWLKTTFPPLFRVSPVIASSAKAEFGSDGKTDVQYRLGSRVRFRLPDQEVVTYVRSVKIRWSAAGEYRVEPELVTEQALYAKHREFMEQIGSRVRELGDRARVFY